MKKIFTQETAITIVIALVMLNNVEHLAWVHYNIARHVFPTQMLNKIHSIAVVVIIELAIIVLVRKGMDVFAGVYTLMLLALSLLYYPLADYWTNHQYEQFISAVIYSLMFTLSIWYFARISAMKQRNAAKQEGYREKWHNTNLKLEQTNAKLQQAAAQLQQYENTLQHITADLQQANEKIQQAEAEKTIPAADYSKLKNELQQLRLFREQTIQARTCEKCGEEFPSEASKRSHIGRCAGKKVNGSKVLQQL